MRHGICLVLASLCVGSSAQAQDSSCVIVRDRVSQHVIGTAFARIAGDSVSPHEGWTTGEGRICWPRGAIGNAARIQAGALGYEDQSHDLREGAKAEVLLEHALGSIGGTATRARVEWRQGQVAIAIALALRDLRRCASVITESCARSYVADVAAPADMSLADSAASAEARTRLRSVGLAFLESVALRLQGSPHNPQLLSESSGITLVTFIDIPDTAVRYTEFRVAIPVEAGRASFGATEMICKASECRRHRQISLTWNVDVEGRFIPSMAIGTDGQSRVVDAFELGPMTRSVAAAPRPREAPTVRRVSIVRGVVRDEKERPLREVQILATPEGNDTRTDSTGRFMIGVAADGGGTVLTARALGYAPAFRTFAATADSAISWEPRLRSVQMLAERVVRETGLPQELSSWRYDEMMARRARGVGYFMIGQEIWSSNSIGDALARVPGVRVKMRYGHTIDTIVIPQCSKQKIGSNFIAPDDKIGVWVNGYEQTRNQKAEDVLEQFSVGSVIAMEVYRGASEIPAEFTSTRYCGVISVWTR